MFVYILLGVLIILIAAFFLKGYGDKFKIDNANETVTNSAEQDIKIKTLDFITTTLSDFATENTYKDHLIDEDATLFRQFLLDKREIAKIKQSMGGVWNLVNSDVRDFSIKSLDNNLYEVFCEFFHEANIENKDPLSFGEGYKLLIYYESGEFRVLAAMSDGLSAFPFLPERVVSLNEDFDLSMFINDDFTVKSEGAMPYDFESIKTKIIDAYLEIKQGE